MNHTYDNICYRKNYIQEVICKFDFASEIDLFKKSMPKKIYKVVKKYYPIAEPQDVIGTELQINMVNSANPLLNQVFAKHWKFFSRNRKSVCTITFEGVAFTWLEYNIFEDIFTSITDVMSAIMTEFPDIQGKRMGLRYINNLPMQNHNDWIDSKFFVAFDAHKDENTTRLITLLEYSVIEHDIGVRLNYGYYNPDYPSIMKSEDFIIDVDAYTSGIIYKEDLSSLVQDMHFENQKCFELMITDEFRKVLNQAD